MEVSRFERSSLRLASFLILPLSIPNLKVPYKRVKFHKFTEKYSRTLSFPLKRKRRLTISDPSQWSVEREFCCSRNLFMFFCVLLASRIADTPRYATPINFIGRTAPGQMNNKRKLCSRASVIAVVALQCQVATPVHAALLYFEHRPEPACYSGIEVTAPWEYSYAVFLWIMLAISALTSRAGEHVMLLELSITLLSRGRYISRSETTHSFPSSFVFKILSLSLVWRQLAKNFYSFVNIV